jgi:hypothetical protein
MKNLLMNMLEMTKLNKWMESLLRIRQRKKSNSNSKKIVR